MSNSNLINKWRFKEPEELGSEKKVTTQYDLACRVINLEQEMVKRGKIEKDA